MTGQTIKVTSSETFSDERHVPAGWKLAVKNGQQVEIGMVAGEPARR